MRSGIQEYFLEGAYRNVHSRLRAHAESIAFFGGGDREGQTVMAYFDNLLAHLYRVIDVRYLPGMLALKRKELALLVSH